MAEGRACSNLGILYQLLNEFEAALKLHKVHLQIAKDLGDRASQGRAYGNIGNAYSSMQQYDLAVRFHKQELAISKVGIQLQLFQLCFKFCCQANVKWQL